jgi:FKBP-type peptidyl-prolyl cis-trans isomerase
MRSQRRGIAAGLLRIVPAGVLAWGIIGCDSPPDIMPIAPPGAQPPRKAPEEEPAQAQGEMAAPALQQTAPPTKVVEYTPAPPTAKGETKTTKSGVKYETLKEGTGSELKGGQTGQFKYVEKLEDGTIVEDRSQRISRPQELTLGEKLTGWREALPGMREGEVRKLTVPPALAYGAEGRKPDVPPNATIIYEVELVRILGK